MTTEELLQESLTAANERIKKLEQELATNFEIVHALTRSGEDADQRIAQLEGLLREGLYLEFPHFGQWNNKVLRAFPHLGEKGKA